MAALLRLIPIIKEIVTWVLPLLSFFKKKKEEEPADKCPTEKK